MIFSAHTFNGIKWIQFQHGFTCVLKKILSIFIKKKDTRKPKCSLNHVRYDVLLLREVTTIVYRCSYCEFTNQVKKNVRELRYFKM